MPPAGDGIPHAIHWDGHRLTYLDQTALPAAERHLAVNTLEDACAAIRELRVRGAPAIGVFAALALCVETLRKAAQSHGDAKSLVAAAIAASEMLENTRPTAVNLRNAMERMRRCARGPASSLAELLDALVLEAEAIAAEDRRMCDQIAEAGLELVPTDARILTHCNTGALATAGVGTALGIIHAAHAGGKRPVVYADETRPLLQGARLTAWELRRAGIEVYTITDSMAAHIMSTERVDLVLVGADRIAANGDTANKIGTHGLSILCRHFRIPFYVAAPTTTFDPLLAEGSGIPIEERDPLEVTAISDPLARARNPAFDVTPGLLVTAFVTELGIHRPPYDFSRLSVDRQEPLAQHSARLPR